MHEEQFWILVSKKICGEATDEELRVLDILVKSNTEWQTIMENLEEFWTSRCAALISENNLKAEDAYLALVNRLRSEGLHLAPEANTVNLSLDSFPEKKLTFYKRQATYWLGALVFLGMIGFLAIRKQQLPSDTNLDGFRPVAANEIRIGAGSRSKILLPDGSQVWVNSSSKLTYSKTFSKKSREVFLDGEAYFDVVKDPAHPFIVHTSSIDIRALGTAFNVKSYAAEPTIEATLVHGSIEVTRPGRTDAPKLMLKPHEKLVFNKNLEPLLVKGDSKTSHVDLADAVLIKAVKRNRPDSEIVETAWVYNKLVFEDTRLTDIASQMEKWYNVNIRIESSKLADYTLTGSFVNENIDEALKMLQYLVPFGYAIEGREVRIFEKQKS
jgi:ferric-dicitrate binding protein FerR (iron transport regulator)